MIWLFLSIVGIGILILSILKKEKSYFSEEYWAFIIVSNILILLAILCLSITGTTVYPKIIGNIEYVKALKSEIQTIKDSHYSKISSGDFIGGSLDNFKQSTVLSEYITNYANSKAKINSLIIKYKIIKKLPMYNLFGFGWAINNEILNLELLK